MKQANKIIMLCGILALLPFYLASPTLAQDPRKDFIVALNKSNVHDFLDEISDITTGQREDMLDDELVDYFNNHISNKGKFKSVMRYQIPGFPTQDIDMMLDKEQYINTIINGQYMMKDYQVVIDIQDLKIGNNGKSATFKSVTKEKGRMPWVKDPKNKEKIEFIPIEGESVCKQKLIVSYNNFIQMAKADCSTVISFDPFAGKPLVPD